MTGQETAFLATVLLRSGCAPGTNSRKMRALPEEDAGSLRPGAPVWYDGNDGTQRRTITTAAHQPERRRGDSPPGCPILRIGRSQVCERKQGQWTPCGPRPHDPTAGR